jgi:hypothetical protein
MRIKLLGRDDDLLLALGAAVVGVGAVAFITTAVTQEAQRRWAQATAGVSTGLGFVLGLPTGRKKEHDKGFSEGFWTPNPAINIDERLNVREAARAARGGGSAVAGAMASGVVAGVAQGVTSVVAGEVADRFSGRGGSAETLRAAPPTPDPLPAKKLLEHMTLTQLRKLAREEGKGGNGLTSASKKEVINLLLDGE